MTRNSKEIQQELSEVMNQLELLLDSKEYEDEEYRTLNRKADKLETELRERRLDEDIRARNANPIDGDKPKTYSTRNNPDVGIKAYGPGQNIATSTPDLSLGDFFLAMTTGAKNEAERKALSEGSDGAGGYTVPDILSANFYDLLRKNLAVAKAGAQFVSLDSDVHKFATIASDPSFGWSAEAGAVNTGDPTFDVVSFAPKRIDNKILVSVELLQDSLNIEEALQTAIIGGYAAEVDRVALYGSGTSNEPLGLQGITGLNTYDYNGVSLDVDTAYTGIMSVMQALLEDNVKEEAINMIISPRDYVTLANKRNTDNLLIGNPEPVDRMFAEGRVHVTSQVLTNESTDSDESKIFLGDFSKLLIGVRSDLRVQVFSETMAGNLQYTYVSWGRLDIQPTTGSAFGMVYSIGQS